MSWNKPGGGKSGGPWGSGGSGGGRNNGQDLDKILQLSQDRFKKTFNANGGGGLGKGMVLILLSGALVLWAITGFYRVEPNEAGVELVFGKITGITPPGLNYNYPSPIGRAFTPNVTKINQVNIGYRGSSRAGNLNVEEESLMLTGDENIVDVQLSVFWVVKKDQRGVADYLFNVENQEGTVKSVSEAAIREVVGRSTLSNILTGGRQDIEGEVKDIIQRTLEEYKAGIDITQVQLLKVDPPLQVIDAFRDVQAARADQERLRNEADAYRNRVVPEARGEAERLRNEGIAYRDRVVNEAQGEADRFKKVLTEYQKAPDVTRQRIYLETLERIYRNSSKILIDPSVSDKGGVLPYLPLDRLQSAPPSQAAPRAGNNGS